MTVFVAVLHSIVLPNGRLVMSDLKDMAIGLGLGDPRTFLATGNLIFTAESDATELETRLEDAFEKRFGKHIDFVVRSAGDWRRMAAANPFQDDVAERVMVRIQRTPLPDGTVAALEPYRPDSDVVRIVGGDLWVRFGGKPSESRLLSALTTKKLGVGTSRIWNTVRRLSCLLDDLLGQVE